MPKKIDSEVHARALRLLDTHGGEYSSLTTAAEAIAKQVLKVATTFFAGSSTPAADDHRIRRHIACHVGHSDRSVCAGFSDVKIASMRAF